MFRPDDPDTPAFDEPWQAQALALADALIKAGHVGAEDWGETLGKALREADASGAEDTLATYYSCVLTALETVSERYAGVLPSDRAERRAAWEAAYAATPHGKPVTL